MYKVFVNEKKLTLSKYPEDIEKNLRYEGFASLEIAVDLLENTSCPEMNVYGENIEEIWEDFTHMFKVIEAAGGVVKNQNGEILFIYRIGKWDLPKGKMEKGESREQSAIREIEEECSLTNLELKRFLMPTFHIYFLREYIIKETFWFEVFYDGVELPLPQTEEGIESVEWKKENEIPELLENSYPNIKLLMDNYLNLN